jgi:hypothetical protein
VVAYWQNNEVLLRAQTANCCRAVLLVGFLGLLGSCSSSTDAVCSSNISISDYVSGFSQGLDNFSEDRYAQLRTDSNSAFERTVNAVTNDLVTVQASSVASKIAKFISVMDSVNWDVNRALDIAEANSAAFDLGSEATLMDANAVEGELVSRCGMPSTYAPPSGGEVTLPMNSIPSPNATDPTMNTVNDSSELSVLGNVVASQFGLTVTDSEATCLGRSLSDVYDVSGANANNAQYQSQFQRAFDSCGIVFVIPS